MIDTRIHTNQMISQLMCFIFMMATVTAIPFTDIGGSLRAHPTMDLTLYENCTSVVMIPTNQTLQLRSCLLPAYLTKSFFDRFKDLRSLEITECSVKNLAKDALTELVQLQFLSFARNNLSVVQAWSSISLINLTSLDLRRNSIQHLNSASFSQYPNLQRLHLAVNSLEDLDDEDTFGGVPQLRYLNLGKNRLRRIDEDYFWRLEHLTHLALHYNQIEYIAPEAFDRNARHLRSLRLEGNRLLSLEFITGSHLIQLTHLNVSYNELESLMGLSFRKDQMLINLDVSNNRLSSMNDNDFEHLSLLEHLNASHNNLYGIADDVFRPVGRVQSIDLSVNNLTSLPPTLISGAWHLHYFNISHNSVQNLSLNFFNGTPQLQILDLSSNQFKTKHPQNSDDFLAHLLRMKNSSKLRLNLQNNLYESVNVNTLLQFSHVTLDRNPWDCQWLIKEIMRLSAHPPGSHRNTIDFGERHHVASAWSDELLLLEGIDCYDHKVSKSKTIIMMDAANLLTTKPSHNNEIHHRFTPAKNTILDNRIMMDPCPTTVTGLPPVPLPWPKIHLEKFDSRSVIIWMLVGIGITFAALRFARQMVDRREHLIKLAQRRTNQLKPATLKQQNLELSPSAKLLRAATVESQLSDS